MLQLLESLSGVQIDLGGGANPQPGFLNMDMRPLPEVDIVHNLEEFPWPLPDECAIRIIASHFIEHVKPWVFMFLMDEAWRVMRPGGQFMISVPYAQSPGYVQDPTHCNPCNEATWAYFDPMHASQLWTIYKPKPWFYRYVSWDTMWNMEALLVKLSDEEELWKEERAKWGPMTSE